MKRLERSKGAFITVLCSFLIVLAGITLFTVNAFKETPLVDTVNTVKEKTSEDTGHKVAIAMAADDNYTYPTLVSITSLMMNSNKDTNYDIYIMVPGEFSKENKEKLLSLQDKYERCKINLINMKDRYKNANDKGPITTPTYYRLSLSSLLPDLDKIIWLDGDTLIFGDLTELYNINMEGDYYRGFLDNNIHGTKDFGVENDHYICAGVMLVNLEELRQNNMEAKFEKFIKVNNEKLKQHDQTVINVVCADKIGVLPAKYGIFNFDNVKEAKAHASNLIAKNRYNESEITDAYNHPLILHCVLKPWCSINFYHARTWWDYAEKTGYIEEIRSFYGFKFNNKLNSMQRIKNKF